MSNRNDKTKNPLAHDIEDAEEVVIKIIKQQHPEWIDADGECPRCVTYEYELADPATPVNPPKKDE